MTDCFSLKIFISVITEELMRKISEEDEQTLEKLNSAYCKHSQMPVSTNQLHETS